MLAKILLAAQLLLAADQAPAATEQLPPDYSQLMQHLTGAADSVESVLDAFGLATSAGVDVESALETPRETFTDVHFQLARRMVRSKQLVTLLTEVTKQNRKLLSGGLTAAEALARLHTLSAEPYGIFFMRNTGTSPALQLLVRKELTSDALRAYAQSLLVRITGLPSVYSQVDKGTASFFHANVGLPSAKGFEAGGAR